MMVRSTGRLKRAGKTLGYGVLGVGTTAIVALLVLNVSTPVRAAVYDLFYLQVGPSEATETAVLTQFLLAGVIALGTAMLAGEMLHARGDNRRPVGIGIVALLAVLPVFLATALVGLAAVLTALCLLAIGFIGIPIGLRYRGGVRSGAVTAFIGGVPVVVVLLLLAGFGLGWGWGYVMTAEEIPESSVDGPVADFDDVPAVRDELFAGDCESTAENRQVCRLYLRGSDHEAAAARFMARHGVRCPYQNAPSGRSDAFIAEHDGTYYRVTCVAHGD